MHEQVLDLFKSDMKLIDKYLQVILLQKHLHIYFV